MYLYVHLYAWLPAECVASWTLLERLVTVMAEVKRFSRILVGMVHTRCKHIETTPHKYLFDGQRLLFTFIAVTVFSI